MTSWDVTIVSIHWSVFLMHSGIKVGLANDRSSAVCVAAHSQTTHMNHEPMNTDRPIQQTINLRGVC